MLGWQSVYIATGIARLRPTAQREHKRALHVEVLHRPPPAGEASRRQPRDEDRAAETEGARPRALAREMRLLWHSGRVKNKRAHVVPLTALAIEQLDYGCHPAMPAEPATILSEHPSARCSPGRARELLSGCDRHLQAASSPTSLGYQRERRWSPSRSNGQRDHTPTRFAVGGVWLMEIPVLCRRCSSRSDGASCWRRRWGL